MCGGVNSYYFFVMCVLPASRCAIYLVYRHRRNSLEIGQLNESHSRFYFSLLHCSGNGGAGVAR